MPAGQKRSGNSGKRRENRLPPLLLVLQRICAPGRQGAAVPNPCEVRSPRGIAAAAYATNMPPAYLLNAAGPRPRFFRHTAKEEISIIFVRTPPGGLLLPLRGNSPCAPDKNPLTPAALGSVASDHGSLVTPPGAAGVKYFCQAHKVNCPAGAREAPLEGVLTKMMEISSFAVWRKNRGLRPRPLGG